ncbi:MAG: hypothetical protein IJU36_04955 [Paludibacteraceae bacterium]|nr:hypothetical protein [Paludibacteraceae bacterium]
MTCEFLKKSDKEQELLKDQYDKLIKARNFHYENLNKWLMSFYVIIGALFLAFYTLYSKHAKVEIELVVAVVGYVVSIAALLSGKGYYYWETNWIMLVHNFEKKYLVDVEKYHSNKEKYLKDNTDDYRTYSVFANFSVNNNIIKPTSGANISTSKVALAITWFISMLWGMIVAYLCIKLLECDCIETLFCKVVVSGLISLFLTQVLIYIGGKQLPSDLRNLDDMKL